jgi:hypothetical protein
VKEKEVRERIQRFLQKTARRMVLPASVGIGVSASACGGHALRQPADAASEPHGQIADAAGDPAELTDVNDDLPIMAVPYLVIAPRDVAPEAEPDEASEAGQAPADAVPDFRPDIMVPPPPYIVPMVSPPGARPLPGEPDEDK